LPVTRIRARTEHPDAPIFRLEGGPGRSNMEFANASRFADRHDVVLVGYRGVDLAGYSLAQRVDDLEAARRALGYRRVNLLSESAGTRTAMTYTWRYPKSVHRSVMIGVNSPGHFLWDARTIDGQIRQYADLCAKEDACRARSGDLAATVKSQAADIADHWGPLSIKQGNVRVASFMGLFHSTSHGAPLSAPQTLDSWRSAAKGDPSGLWLQSLLAKLVLPDSYVFA
jgi:pimeloyl-ACP methyl ester carboxylesterase